VDRREEILDAALALADERGLAAVSMRAVAQRAGVTPMALYPHVGSKAALLDGMVGRPLGELLPAEPASGKPTRPAAALLFSRPAVTVDAVRAVDQIYPAMLEAGVPAAAVPRLERLVSTLVPGFAASEVGGRFGPMAKQQRQLRGADLPGHAKLAEILQSPADLDSEFEADPQDLLRLIEQVAAGLP
jgi:AcrR family transcriptional regulator